MIHALKHPKTRALQEQVMLAVTSVHDCRYCDWVHTGAALKQDVDLQELQQMLQLNQADQTKPTVLAILCTAFADQNVAHQNSDSTL
jgi:AhpD family alkylhydroperoxidase